jgi:hypothetical protein
MAEASPAATQAAGTTQLAVGLPAGIEGAIHATREHWETQADQPDFGFLQIDAKNAFFNELDRTTMLYVTLYLWPQGARLQLLQALVNSPVPGHNRQNRNKDFQCHRSCPRMPTKYVPVFTHHSAPHSAPTARVQFTATTYLVCR